MKKSTNAEVEKRVSEIQGLLLNGYTRHHILKYAEKWEMSDSMIDQYIVKATNRIKEVNALNFQDNMALVTNNLWDLFREARIDGDRKIAIQCLQQLAKIKGLEQHNVNVLVDDKRDLESMTNDDLDKILENAPIEDRH